LFVDLLKEKSQRHFVLVTLLLVWGYISVGECMLKEAPVLQTKTKTRKKAQNVVFLVLQFEKWVSS
jgi:hypothetical protein